MGKIFNGHSFILATAVVLACLVQTSCSKYGSAGRHPSGRLFLAFSGNAMPLLRAAPEGVDTNSFILSVKDNRGNSIYEGSYGNAPEAFSLEEGSYVIRAVSSDFRKPAFSAPQYGDEQLVILRGGEDLHVILRCVQMNAGVRLEIGSSFLAAYPDGALLLKSEDGSLMYGYRESRIAYFNPGEISLILTSGPRDRVLMKRYLRSRDILTLSVSASLPDPSVPENQKGSIRLDIDSTRNWINEDFVIGQDAGHPDGDSGDVSGGEDRPDMPPQIAMTVAEAIRNPGMQDVWVHGFIAGGDLTTASANYTPPFSSRSNLLLAPRAGYCSRESCIAVSLPEGRIRDAINLVEHPELLGRSITVKGNIVDKYFKITGLKNIHDYRL